MSTDNPENTEHPDLQRLRRWEDSGGTWVVAARRAMSSGETVTLSLMTCDGGEEMDVFSSADPVLVEYVSRDAR
ncbi:hypothetical protein GCM10010977_02380 [Citricoccus zhacaiensis]|uniref:DUF2188 domain-containing protein n=1 Tax=Citricoccus zhacaiensis TaxID=489142 RepID=A0ABQ2LML7_9MICC|nr:hypothetical protein [Citricoccus zhacaiensis]GGO40309.1 hypothetical protein GCM10010977_02380 [Citricoccus zhacaiensis]